MAPFSVALADATFLRELRHALASWLDEGGARNGTREALVLATHEAATNGIVHGNAGDAVLVEASRDSDGAFLVVVRNKGTWTQQDSEAGGKGLAIMRALMSEVEIRTTTEATTEVFLHMDAQGPEIPGVPDGQVPHPGEQAGE